MGEDFTTRLMAGEKLLWSGQPAQGIIFVERDALLIPFSLIWGGFAIFWETQVLSHPRVPGFFALWGIPFVLIGLYLVFGRFLLDAWVRRGTRYALTTERVLISRSWPASAFTVIDLDRLPPLVLSEAGDGSGTIRFGTGIASGRGNFASWNPSLDPTPQFLRIAAVRQVFDQLQRAARTVQDR